jgi:hypothetical protein
MNRERGSSATQSCKARHYNQHRCRAELRYREPDADSQNQTTHSCAKYCREFANANYPCCETWHRTRTETTPYTQAAHETNRPSHGLIMWATKTGAAIHTPMRTHTAARPTQNSESSRAKERCGSCSRCDGSSAMGSPSQFLGCAERREDGAATRSCRFLQPTWPSLSSGQFAPKVLRRLAVKEEPVYTPAACGHREWFRSLLRHHLVQVQNHPCQGRVCGQLAHIQPRITF